MKNVCCGVIGTYILGSIFIDQNLTGGHYLVQPVKMSKIKCHWFYSIQRLSVGAPHPAVTPNHFKLEIVDSVVPSDNPRFPQESVAIVIGCAKFRPKHSLFVNIVYSQPQSIADFPLPSIDTSDGLRDR